MASPKISIIRAIKRGLTLIEVLISLALLTFVGGFSLYFSMDDTRAYTFRDDRDKIVSVLQRARAESMHGICRSESCITALPHGVYRGEHALTLFEGSTYETRDEHFDEIIELKSSATTLSGFSEVIFMPYSGRVATVPSHEASLTVSDGLGHESVIEVNEEGRIFWTN